AVYETFYGLTENPFNITPDPRFLFLTPSHRAALNYLEYGVEERKGFLVVTGEVGVGKTLLIRTLLQRVDSRTETALVMNARLTFKELMILAVRDWNLPVQGQTKLDLLIALQEYLVDVKNHGGNVLLIIDEAQNLSAESLEEFRLLSNMETSTQKLLQIVLAGQPELKVILNQHGLRQLRQRIPGICDIKSLDPDDVGDYVRHRQSVAGLCAPNDWIFDEAAIDEIYRNTEGIPRSINQLCDRALLLGYQRNMKVLGSREIIDAMDALKSGDVHWTPARRGGKGFIE
ncbi:MAG: AAA family ATPase, partial [Candidatus Eisenbacteria bacterium]|nr:AAA family ATPase [Candidatus Eisenbacteria bacterium]